MNYKMNLIVDEARRILMEQPELKYYEAITQAKKILKEVHQGGNLSGPKHNNLNKVYHSNGGL